MPCACARCLVRRRSAAGRRRGPFAPGRCGIQAHRAPQHADAAVVLAPVGQGAAHIGEDVGILAVQIDRPLGGGEGLFALAVAGDQSDQVANGQDQGQIGLGEGQLRVTGNGLAHQVGKLPEALLAPTLEPKDGVSLVVK